MIALLVLCALLPPPLHAHLEHFRAANARKFLSARTLARLGAGAVQGYSSRAGARLTHVFKGIPYAEPPEAEYRFTRPEPKAEWDGVWDATEYSDPCPAWDPRTDSFNGGTEDCLTYNVFADDQCTQTHKCPVLVFLAEDARALEPAILDKYVPDGFVAVTFNFRTGIFGFLDLGLATDETPTNVGLLDVALALRTVRAAAGALGGDADRLTLVQRAADGRWASGAADRISRLVLLAGGERAAVEEAEAEAVDNALATARTLAALRCADAAPLRCLRRAAPARLARLGRALRVRAAPRLERPDLRWRPVPMLTIVPQTPTEEPSAPSFALELAQLNAESAPTFTAAAADADAAADLVKAFAAADSPHLQGLSAVWNARALDASASAASRSETASQRTAPRHRDDPDQTEEEDEDDTDRNRTAKRARRSRHARPAVTAAVTRASAAAARVAAAGALLMAALGALLSWSARRRRVAQPAHFV